ncbi:mediator of RNA polymerase II transcription subunit 15-like, partial [Rhagoletis pomonella]|uniref:mediator of RNA polymerase II transcription subunit 15-like n=1 Tax=Rhagoletis pomonella TaxID=28610 RepID=UPI00177ECBB2
MKMHLIVKWNCFSCCREIQANTSTSGEWIKDYTRGSSGAVDHLPTTDVLRRSIRRSWTISNPEDDSNNQNPQNPGADNLYPQQNNLIESQSAGSYPSLVRPPSQQRPHPTAYQSGSVIGISTVGAAHPQPTSDYLVNTQRRVLRQSTLPSSLPNNDPNLSGSGANLANYNYVNLTAPTSPHQMQKSPIYPSAYNSDDIINMSTTDCDNYSQQIHQQQQQKPMNIQPQQQQQPQSVINPQTHHRLQVRRQSTLPANPCQPPMYLSTSPNRPYSRSPERSPGEQRYPPFMRQTSFPCNMAEPPTQQQQQPKNHLNFGTTPPTNQSYQRKLLPTSPNYQGSAMYQQQPTQQQQQVPPQQPAQSNYDPQTGQTQPADEMDYTQVMPKARMLRQATLPNPDQHVKLLPTSPPKRQTSPQYRRSPEFMRQQTLPNPEAFSGNSLSVPPGQAQAKFMPLSPRHKQNFLFPNVQRQFLSQQHVPAVGVSSADVITTGISAGEQYSSSQSVNIQSREHAKMMKVRSHSNEEYSITKPYHTENRRLLPEIPTNRASSRSPSRLVRQECIKDERSNATDANTRTFGEAKQQFNQFQNVTEEADNRPEYMDYFGDSTSSFLEADEVQYEKNYNAGFSSEPRIIYNDGSDDGSYNQYQRPMVHSAETVLVHDQNYSYYGADGGLSAQALTTGLSASGGALPRTPQMHNRLRRRQSRELQIQQEEMAHLNRQATAGMTTTTGGVEPTVVTSASGAGASANSEAHDTQERRKPEQMRSISEDSGAKTNPQKPVTRRSLSHPEKGTQFNKKVEPTKIPSPKPLADILDKTRTNTKIPTPRRRNSRDTNGADTEDGTNKPYSNERRNSDVSLKSANKKHEQQQHTGEQKLSLPSTKLNGNNKSPEKKDEFKEKTNKTKDSDSNDQAKSADEMQKQNPTVDTTEGNKGVATTIPKQHTTTLGEQEIQNAVEAAAVVFKKVVLQRRQEKKAAEEDVYDMETSSELELKSITFNHQHYNMEADEFKLVFINSSDSSSSGKDEEFEDSSSTTSSTHNYSSITIDDCDWDYFEPSMICTSGSVTKQIFFSPCPSPLVMRRSAAMRDFKSSESTASPAESPLLYRKPLVYCPRIRESDTGTDEEMLMQGESSSQTSSDGYFVRAPTNAAVAPSSTGRQQHHQHHQQQQQNQHQ